MIKKTKRLFVMLIALIAVFGLLSCSGGNDGSQNQSNSGAQASTINVPLFRAQDIDGQWHSAEEWLGKQPVVINFWGTWCPPCRREIPDLVKLYDEYKVRGVELVGIAVNDDSKSVKKFAAANNMDWVLLMGQEQIAVDYKATGVPMTVFIDKNGKEVWRHIGLADYQTLKQGFDAIL